jgi:hypothetical protein
MNDEFVKDLEKMKIMAYSRYYPEICLEGLRNTAKIQQ